MRHSTPFGFCLPGWQKQNDRLRLDKIKPNSAGGTWAPTNSSRKTWPEHLVDLGTSLTNLMTDISLLDDIHWSQDGSDFDRRRLANV